MQKSRCLKGKLDEVFLVGLGAPSPTPKLMKYYMIRNLSCMVSLEMTFNSEHISHKNQNQKSIVWKIESLKWM